MSAVHMDDEEEERDEPLITIKNEDAKNGTVSTADGAISSATAAYDEDDEVDEPILPSAVTSNADTAVLASAQIAGGATASMSFNEASVAIASDNWDVSSWIIFIEEAERQRSGNVTVEQAYKKILEQFPRSAKFWQNLAEYHLQHHQFMEAEAVFQQCLKKCRNVDLWTSYLAFQKDQFDQIVQSSTHVEQYHAAREKCDEAFDSAVENVGLAIDSYPIWRYYLDYVNSWSEATALDANKKLTMQRQVYQMAVCVAMDQVDDVWNAYEAFEKHQGQASADTILPEFNRKYLHAKSILRERRKLTSGIMFNRLAVPPTNSETEFQQLEMWNNWIIFEMTKPDHLNPDSFVPMVQMIYDQCLNCFLYNAEIWMSLVQFELEQAEYNREQGKLQAALSNTHISDEEDTEQKAEVFENARAVFIDAIEYNPTVTLLRTALAELEEAAGRESAALEVLRVSFEQLPSGFTFSLYQRMVRRIVGMKAARKLFSETLSLRAADEQLGLQLFLAHAKLELEVNCQQTVALKVLSLAKSSYPQCIQDIGYVRALTTILMQMGDLKQIRCVFQQALRESSSVTAEDGGSNSVASCLYTGGSRGGTQYRYGVRGQQLSSTAVLAAANSIEKLRNERELWDEYLRVETKLGLSSVIRLNELRNCRDRAKAAYEEAERMRLGIAFNSREESRAANLPSIFLPARLLSERYSYACPHHTMVPELDEELHIRTRLVGRTPGEKLAEARMEKLGAVITKESLSYSVSIPGNGPPRRDREMMNMSADFHLSMVGLPAVVRDFLAKLPFHVGPPPDIGGFIRHMKSTVLPPRPADELVKEENGEEDEAVSGENGAASDAAATSATTGPSWLLKAEKGIDMEEDGADSSAPVAGVDTATNVLKRKTRGGSANDGATEDVFRKRQRTRSKKK